jgi:peptidoglycan/LPS O-acetylase OafA/YrhL
VVREGWFARPLEHPWMRYLGKISYGLYVYHYAILWLLTEVIFQDMGMLTGALIALLLTILTASVSFYLIEKPITDLKDRWFPFKPAAKPAQNL